MTKSLKKSLLIVLVSVLALVASILCISAVSVKATSAPVMNGASIRLDEGKTGLRFRAKLASEPSQDSSYGMIIIPEDFLADFETDNYIDELNEKFNNDTTKYINATVTPYEEVADSREWYVRHSIVNINTWNYARGFVGIAYEKIGENITYSEVVTADARSITYVSSAALNDLVYNDSLEEDLRLLYTAKQTTLENFVKTAVGENFTLEIADVNLYTAHRASVSLNTSVDLAFVSDSDATSVATFSSNGINGLSAGSATVTLKTAGGLYEDSFEVTVTNEPGVVSPYNGALGISYVTNSNFGNGGGLTTNATYLTQTQHYEGEAYSLANVCSKVGNNYRVELENALISNLNETDDGQPKNESNNYLYNYISVPVLCKGATEDTLPSFSFNLQGKVKMQEGVWTVYTATRIGDSFLFNGIDIFNRSGTNTNYGSASDLNGGGTNGYGMRLYISTTSTSGNFHVYFGAIRVGFDENLVNEEILIATYENDSKDNNATTSQLAPGNKKNQPEVSGNTASNGTNYYTYRNETYSRYVKLTEVTSTTDNVMYTVKFQNLTENNLNATDSNGNYLYNYIALRIVQYTADTAATTVWFNWAGYYGTNNQYRIKLTPGEWVELRAVRDGDTFKLNGQDIFATSPQNSVCHCIIDDINGLHVYFESKYNANTRVRISALALGLNPNANQSGAGDV